MARRRGSASSEGMSDVQDTLKRYFYDERYGFKNASAFHKTLKRLKIDIPLKVVAKFVSEQDVTQIHKIKNEKTKFQKIVGQYHEYQCDLMFLKGGVYEGLCNLVHINSRMLFSFAFTKKSILVDKFKEMVQKNDLHIKILRTDGGGEFKGEFHSMLQDLKIEHRITPPTEKNKMFIVERLNGTIRNRITRWTTATGSTDYEPKLQKFVDNYNDTFHTGIGTTPRIAFSNKVVEDAIIRMKSKANKRFQDGRYQLGDKVRYKLKRQAVGHNDRRFSATVHTVTKVNKKSYRISGKPDLYQHNQLLKATENANVQPDILEESLRQERAATRTRVENNRLRSRNRDGPKQKKKNPRGRPKKKPVVQPTKRKGKKTFIEVTTKEDMAEQLGEHNVSKKKIDELVEKYDDATFWKKRKDKQGNWVWSRKEIKNRYGKIISMGF